VPLAGPVAAPPTAAATAAPPAPASTAAAEGCNSGVAGGVSLFTGLRGEREPGSPALLSALDLPAMAADRACSRAASPARPTSRSCTSINQPANQPTKQPISEGYVRR
jgi:hypothetical protein